MNPAGKPIKPMKLVLEAIHNLRAQKGFTTKEITNYIFSNHNVNEKMVTSVVTALKRGTDYGILQYNNHGRYSICEGPGSRMVFGKKEIDPPDCFPKMKRRRRSHSRCGGKSRRSHRRRRSRRSRSKCGGRRHKRRSQTRRRRNACGSKRRRRSHKRSRGCGSRRRHRSRRRQSHRRKC